MSLIKQQNIRKILVKQSFYPHYCRQRPTIMMRFNNIPEFGDETLEILKTYVHPEGKKPVADEGKPKK